MNKNEFKSAYNKITLSEEFKAEARAKLTEQFGTAVEKYPDDNVIEEHPTAAINVIPKAKQNKSPWKSIVGIGSAAAVIGLGIWGGSVWLDRTQNPLDDQPTTEVSETVETNEVVDAVTSELTERRVTFPAYYDEDGELYDIAKDMEPFGLTIALPQEWEIVVPSGENAMGLSMVFIMDGGEYVGAIDCGTYSRFDGVEYGDPNYHQTILTDLMTRSDIKYDGDFIEADKKTCEWINEPFGFGAVENYANAKTDDMMSVGTCTMYRYHEDHNNVLYYGSGILAYDADAYKYVYACFADELDEKLLSDIVSSVELNASVLTAQSITFPAYYDALDENNKLVSDIVPFELGIALPEGWEIIIPEQSEHIGYSMVYIMSDGEYVGSIDINKYEKYEGIEYGEPNYHQMVFNQLMLSSTVNWGFDYTEVKTDGWMKSATCSVYHNPANGYADDVEYTSGILAYEDDMQVYVNIYFNRTLEEKLHAEIAESISITESTMGLADRLAALMIEQESGLRYNWETDLRIDAVDLPCGTYISVAYPIDDSDTAMSVYEIRNSRINDRLPFRPALVYAFEDSFIYKECSVLPNGRRQDRYTRYTPGVDRTYDTYEIIAEFEYSLTDDDWVQLYDIVCNTGDGEISLTSDEMVDYEIEITDGFISIFTFPSAIHSLNKHTKCNVEDLATIIRQTLYAMERIPEEEPVPMPPNLYLDAEGAERPLLMGSYTWGDGLDEFHHDGWTIEDAVSAGRNYVYPASWFEDARLVIPEGGVIASVTLHTDELNYTELEFTADGAIILPDEPVGEHIWVNVEYPEGACRYLMTVDFPETSEPPAVTLNGEELTIGSYFWNGELSGDHPRNKDVYQMFLDGELLTVSDEYTVYLELPEGARLIEALCFGEGMESEMMLGCEESGEVRLPTANVKIEGVVRLGVEYPDGSVSYWMGFRHTAEEYSVPEML